MASDDLSRERAIRAEAIKAAVAMGGDRLDVIAHSLAHYIQTGERQYIGADLRGSSHLWCSLGDKCWYWRASEAR